VEQRFDQRVGELLTDAEHAVARDDWAAVRALAAAALALEPANSEARRLLVDADARAPRPGERRQLTVMFCDIVGSTPLSGRVDPEVVRDVMVAYQTVWHDAISQFGGQIFQYQGDGVLAYFGHPTAHEDDALRAVKAGLSLLARVGELEEQHRRERGIELGVRVAVHTGLVVIGEVGAPAQPSHDAVVGETPNIAARLQEHAAPGTLVISESTYELVRGAITARALGTRELRGVARPLEVYEVVAEISEPHRAERGTPFVGREAELAHLSELWELVSEGGGSAILMRGEAGIGKSRLGEVFLRRVTTGRGMAIACTCSRYHTATDLYPVRRLVLSACGVDQTAPRERVRRLRDALSALDLEQHHPLFVTLLGLPHEDWCPPPELDGLLLRESMLSALVEWMAACVQRSPHLVVIDDMQWSDPSTLDFLARVVARRLPGLMLLLLGRGDFRSPWSEATVTTVELGRLSEAALAQIAAELPEGRDLSPARLARLMDRSDGIPLHFEELVRTAGVSPLPPASEAPAPRSEIPSTLLDPLLARLGGPGVDLALAQTLATIGHEVRHELVCAVAGLADGDLRARLSGLIAAGIIETDDREPPTYRFRHHLLGELAYEIQLLPIRVRRHSEIADILTAAPLGAAPTDGGMLAYHLEHARRYAEAIDAYVRASRVLQSHGAHAEATVQLNHAVDLLPSVSDERERKSLELTVRQWRGFSAVSTMGFAAPDAVIDYERCLELCREMKLGSEQLPSLTTAWSYYALQGRLAEADELIARRRELGDLGSDAVPEAGGIGAVEFFRGRYTDAAREIDEFLATPYALLPSVPDEWPLPNDSVGTLRAHLAVTQWIMGEPGAARDSMRVARTRAEQLGFPHGPYTLAYVLSMTSLMAYLAGADDAALAATDEMLSIADRHGFAFWTMCAHVHRGIIGARRGDAHALESLSGSANNWRALGVEVWAPWYLTEQGAGCIVVGDLPKALALFDDAEATAEGTDARFYHAETLRLRGEARLAGGDDHGVDDLARAVAVAHEQGARLFELRARVAQCRAGVVGAHDDLGALVDTFANDVELPELIAAREVLALAGHH
jgi:class 3 adenylate cyclase/tetratricopeptide (TPR) repeat protein